MKLLRIIALAAICATLASGCDAVRSALGKPTSKDIAALRAQRAQMQHTVDSLAVEMGVADAQDSLALMTEDSLQGNTGAPAATVASADPGPAEAMPLSGSETAAATPEEEKYEAEGLAEGFWVVLGSFKNEDNARYFYNSLSASGAEVELVKMKNGFTAVMICHGDSYEESYRKMLDFYKNEKRPEDIWIYNTAKKMHIQ